MKLFSILILFFLFFVSCDSKNKSNSQTDQISYKFVIEEAPEMIANRLLVKPIYVLQDPIKDKETINNARDKAEEESEFSKIISRIPITPLPFGITNLDKIDIAQAPNTLLEAPIDYDKENVYGLNIFFEERKELDPYVEHDGRCMPNLDYGGKIYFSRRLPNLKSGEIVLLYYFTQPQSTRIGTGDGESYIKKWIAEKWLLLVCDPSGKALYSESSILSADEYIRLSYIDENYTIRTRHYQTPTVRAIPSDRTPNGETDEVNDDVIKAKLTTLFIESSYKLRRPTSDKSFSETGRWNGMDDSHNIKYLWVDNKPVEVKHY